MRKVDVAIIGAGTAGLSARNAVAKKTDNYVVIDPGPLGTLCAQAGCMPSKALIHLANDIHAFSQQPPGLTIGSVPQVDSAKVMAQVRKLRDYFVASVLEDMESWKDQHLISRQAHIIDPQTLDLEGERLEVDRLIIATGSQPVIPVDWKKFSQHLLTSDDVFELDTLPAKMAVIGLGPLGIELAQSLSRLGVDMVALDPSKAIGGSTDPQLQDYIASHLKEELKIHFEQAHLQNANDGLEITTENQKFSVDKVLIAVGRKATIEGLGLENLGVELNKKGLPEIDRATMQVGQLPVYMVGDVNGSRPLLHEAANEGYIAGSNAVKPSATQSSRMTPLSITFCSPNIAIAGRSFQALKDDGIEFVVGSVDYVNQGRARLMGNRSGLIRIYCKPSDGSLLGAELFAPEGEHLGHLLAWAISQNLTTSDLLKMPYYHPSLEEGIRTAIRDAARQL